MHQLTHADKGSKVNPPRGVIAMDCSCELSLGSVPLSRLFEWNVRSSVMYHCECTHPEVESQPREQPPLDKPHRTRHDEQGKEHASGESSDGQPTHLSKAKQQIVDKMSFTGITLKYSSENTTRFKHVRVFSLHLLTQGRTVAPLREKDRKR